MRVIITARVIAIAAPNILSYNQIPRIESNRTVGVYVGHGGQWGSDGFTHMSKT